MTPLNIVFKSTTHVSIGDDIALLGTKHLFNTVVPGHNMFLYSRNEKDTWKPTLPMNVDLVVIAGTPVWSGSQMASLEDYIIDNKKRTFYCGVGMNYGNNSKTSAALANSIGFVGRDNHATKRAKVDTDAVAICCPSIFCTDPRPQTDDRIGVIIQVDSFLEKQVNLIKRLPKDQVLVICNEIVDYIWAEANLPGYEIVYSRLLEDLIAGYLRCKEIYAMRIHGAHLAYALGIPTVCIKNEKDKSVVCKKIGLKLVDPDVVTSADMECDQSIKAQKYQDYIAYVSAHIDAVFPGRVPADLLSKRDNVEKIEQGKPAETIEQGEKADKVEALAS